MYKPLEIIHQGPGETADETARRGFKIQTGDNSFVQCYEGFALSRPNFYRPEDIEPQIFHPHYVEVDTSEQRGGIGRLLVHQAFREAKERGFGMARVDVASPYALRMLHSLRREGVITGEHYVHTPYDNSTVLNPYRPTQEIMEIEPSFTSSTEAYQLFKPMILDGRHMIQGIRQGRIEGVLQL